MWSDLMIPEYRLQEIVKVFAKMLTIEYAQALFPKSNNFVRIVTQYFIMHAVYELCILMSYWWIIW